MLACLFIMQAMPVSALAAELTEEETQELVNLLPAEPQDMVELEEVPVEETPADQQTPETDEPEQPTVVTDETETETPDVQQPQQEVPVETIVPAIEVMSEEQKDVTVELQNGTAVIPSDATEDEIKEELYEALVVNKDELGEDFDPQSLDWEYYCEGKSSGTGWAKNSAWGSINGFESQTGDWIKVTYTHPALAANSDGTYRVRLKDAAEEVSLTKAAKLGSSIELKEGDYTVALPYMDFSTVDYDALCKRIFEKVVASVEPDLDVNDVTIKYYAENVVLGQPAGTHEWAPLSGGTIKNALGMPYDMLPL